MLPSKYACFLLSDKSKCRKINLVHVREYFSAYMLMDKCRRIKVK